MKFLLTSAGISNTSIHDTLVDLLGKPIAGSSALCIPTAAYAMPGVSTRIWRLRPFTHLCASNPQIPADSSTVFTRMPHR